VEQAGEGGMRRPVLLDLFCGAGGAAMGYHRAGFDVVGVDIAPQPRYPFLCIETDVMALDIAELAEVAGATALHASPPCQKYTLAQQLQRRPHPDLVSPVRQRLQAVGLPYVIENVVGAPLRNPTMLCGAMFGLRTYRHRLFESSVGLFAPVHSEHIARTATMGRPVAPGEFIHVVGNFSNAPLAREAMGTPWMTRDEMREAIPPAYTEFIGRQLLSQTNEVAA